MRINRSLSLITGLLLLSSPLQAWADDYYVEAATGIGVDSSIASAVTELVRSSVPEAGGTLTDDRTQARFALRAKVIRLGATLIVTLEKRAENQVVNSNQLKAAHEDELDTVTKRLVRAAVKDENVQADAKIGEVTESEATQGMVRKGSRRGWSLGLGPVILSNLNVSGVGLNFHGTLNWDLNVAMLFILADLSWRNDAILSTLGLGGKYFFTETVVAPFVGADLGIAAARMGQTALLSDSYSGGFSLAGSAGVHIFRTSSVNLEVSGRFEILFNETFQGFPYATSIRLSLHVM